jgi:hypothetical protein
MKSLLRLFSRSLPLSCALATAALLVACGDNPAEAPAVAADPSVVPASAMTNAKAYATYVGSLAPSEAGEPVRTGVEAAPSSETEDPQAV